MAERPPATPKPAHAKETWRDWLPPGAPEPPLAELLTRADILDWLDRRRLAVRENDLRFWEGRGVLPRPWRKWRDGAARALYPPWYPPLVRELRRLQRDGYPLADIGPLLREYLRATPYLTAAWPTPVHELPQVLLPVGVAPAQPWPALAPTPGPLDYDTVLALRRFARGVGDAYATAVANLALVVTLRDGQERTFHVPLDPEAPSRRPRQDRPAPESQTNCE